MSRKISVIIPYYQEESGILRQAVAFAISEPVISDLDIVVVDDGAPVSARDELTNLDLPTNVTLKVIEQPNRGPGAARNRGLDHVSPDTEYVAFLDSDDSWTANHLSNALCGLAEGSDLYFADFWFSDHGVNAFAKGDLKLEQHVCIDPARKLYIYRGDLRLDLICPHNCIHLPTVVYRFAKFRGLRFPEEFAIGEDRVFLLKLSGDLGRVVFGAEIECVSGRGLHICQNAGWGSEQAIWHLYQDMLWRKWMRKNGLLSDVETKENARSIKKLRRSFCASFLHDLRRMRAFRNPNVLRFLNEDPESLLYVLPTAFRIAAARMRRLR